MNLDGMKPQPILDTVQFESTPPGADAKTSNGQSCRTPCALALPTNGPLTVTFTLTGYQPDTESLDPITLDTASVKLQPNPVMAELQPAAPPPKPVKKPAPKKKKVFAAKPAAKPATQSAAKPAAAAPTAAQPASPWPAAPAPKQ
jgi:hypothetical protein